MVTAGTRIRLLWTRALTGALLGLPLACLHVDRVAPTTVELAVAGMIFECPVGSAGCPCTGGGGCDPGLVCSGGTCTYAGDESPISYEFEDDYAEAEAVMISEPSPGKSARAGRASKRDRMIERKSFEPSPAAAEGNATIDAAIVQPVGGLDGQPQLQPPDSGPAISNEQRQIIYTAGLQVSVYDLDAAMLIAEELPERWGGWIEARYDYQITLRLPAARLFEAITELSELGTVLSKSLQADDVTAEYVDLAARIHVLEQIVARLEALLKRAESVEQALEIRVELDRARIDLESARAQMRQMSESIDFSTLTLWLSQRGPQNAVPSSNDPFPWVDSLGLENTEYR
jgi:hypothetical protein